MGIRNSFAPAEDEDLSIFEDLFDVEEEENLDDEFFSEESDDSDALNPKDPPEENIDDDFFYDEEDEENDEDEDEDEDEEDEEGEEENKEEEEVDIRDQLLASLLSKKGILDPNKIFYEDEDGVRKEYNFFDLPIEEQIAILGNDETSLNETELETISYLREHDVTLVDVIEHFSRRAVEEYKKESYMSGLNIDQFSDEELFKLDLKSKYSELTDEEIDLQYQNELSHPTLFDKKISLLRKDYAEAEARQIEEAELQKEEEELRSYNELAQSLVQSAESIEDIGGLELSIDNKNEVLDFILDRDVNGFSKFDKSLNDPNNKFKLAWFLLKGDEAFEMLHDYYKKVIDSRSKVKSDTQPVKAKAKVITRKTTNSSSRRSTNNQHDNTKVMNPFAKDSISLDDIE